MAEQKLGPAKKIWPIASLLFGAVAWGIIWYPYRVLAQAGVSGTLSTLLTYTLALLFTMAVFPSAWRQFKRAPRTLMLMGLAAGWCNLAYVLGMLQGEVVRVLLLFYLAPVWTVPLAHFLLDEKLSRDGYVVGALALSGAAVMLWNPASGLPLPGNAAEWLGLSAGFAFAVSNVLARRANGCGTAVKSLSIFVGVTLVALVSLLFETVPGNWHQTVLHAWGWIAGIGVTLVAMSLAVQFGLSHLSANQAIVILLFELVVAAISAYFLAGEVMGLQEWLGGGMIVAASLFSGRMEHKPL